MTGNEVERKVRHAVERLTPDALAAVLSRCAQRQSVYIAPPARRASHWLRAATACAAAFALVFTGVFTAGRIADGRADALIMLDVNPSLALRINRHDRVLDVTARNEDAARVLDDMDLKNVPVDVAVNALIGSMLKYGYIQESANTILLSVEGANGEKTALLQKNLTESIGMQLRAVNGAVVSQSLEEDPAIRALADSYRISYGQASLIQKILDENIHLMFDELARLSVNELALLSSANGGKIIWKDGMGNWGEVSDTAYIGEARARQIALAHANLPDTEATAVSIELDYDEGRMIYEVEFSHEGIAYEYELNAKDGSVLQSDRKDGGKRAARRENAAPQDAGDFIGNAAAAEIAKTHADTAVPANLKVKLDKDDGLYLYEVEFEANGYEYDYEINATTGEILDWEKER